MKKHNTTNKLTFTSNALVALNNEKLMTVKGGTLFPSVTISLTLQISKELEANH